MKRSNKTAEELKSIRDDMINYFNLTDQKFDEMIENEKVLQENWYNSWQAKEDTSFYNKIDYITMAYTCYKYYSRKDCINLIKYSNEHKLEFNTVIDIGAGFGGTTKLFAEAFPEKKVVYQNLHGIQFDYAKHYLNGINNINISEKLVKSDLVNAMELMEHIQKPTEFLDEIVKVCNPKYIVLSSAFNVVALGHWSTFIVNNESIPCKSMPRLFGSTLKSHGFTKIQDTGFWNSRPSIYVRKQS